MSEEIPLIESGWRPGDGASNDDWKKYKKLEIDPNDEARTIRDNYGLVTSAITPRPIGFISTISNKGEKNLAPISLFQFIAHDPPLFVFGVTSGRALKDTTRNLLENGELTANIISEWFLDAANFAAVNAPPGVDEWKLTGLTPLESTLVKPPHVAESAFSVEGKVTHHHQIASKKDATKHNSNIFIFEGVKFHVREDMVNAEQNHIDIKKYKPIARISNGFYGPSTDAFRIPYPNYAQDVEASSEAKKLIADDLAE